MRSSRAPFVIVLCAFLLYPIYSQCSEQDQLILLGTIGTGGSTSRAIIKNHVTGKLKTYSQGDAIPLANGEYATVKEISSCMVILKNSLRYETVECDSAPSEVTFRAPSTLAGFDVIDETLGAGIKLRDSVNYNIECK